MPLLKFLFWIGFCLSAWVTITAETNIPVADNIRWVSLDFKTILTWNTKRSNHTYSVLYSWDNKNWVQIPECTQVSESECDLTDNIQSYDRTFSADIKTELETTMDYNYDHDVLPHAYSPGFNPYKDSNISAVKFTVEAVDDSKVRLNIEDPLTSLYKSGKQLNIRDVLRNDLKYKISYWKSGSTGKRDTISDSSMTEVSGLAGGIRYCFMVAAYIPSRPKTTHQGAWSRQQCTDVHGHTQHGLSVGSWVGLVFGLITITVIIVTVTVLCCKQRNKPLHTSQTSHTV